MNAAIAFNLIYSRTGLGNTGGVGSTYLVSMLGLAHMWKIEPWNLTYFFWDENGLEENCAGSGQNGLRWEAICHLEQEINGTRCMFMHSLPLKMYPTTVLPEETGTAEVLLWITSSIKVILSNHKLCSSAARWQNGKWKIGRRDQQKSLKCKMVL